MGKLCNWYSIHSFHFIQIFIPFIHRFVWWWWPLIVIIMILYNSKCNYHRDFFFCSHIIIIIIMNMENIFWKKKYRKKFPVLQIFSGYDHHDHHRHCSSILGLFFVLCEYFHDHMTFTAWLYCRWSRFFIIIFLRMQIHCHFHFIILNKKKIGKFFLKKNFVNNDAMVFVYIYIL